MNSETSIASLIVVLGFPPVVLYQINKHILFRSLDGLHFIFFQLVFFFAYHHLLGIPSLSTALINYLSSKTLRQSNNNNNNSSSSNNNNNKKSSEQQANNNKDNKHVPTNSRQISSTQNSAPIIASKNKYSEITTKLLDTILDFVDTKNDDSPWNLIYEDKETDVKVYQNPKVSDCCYKVTGTMENTPQTTFDLLADVRRRSEWDPMTDEAGILEIIDESTRVQYIKMKAVFPTSARDVVTIGYSTQLEDGRMVMVNKSIEHKLCPEKPGIVRIEAGCAGVVVAPIKDQPNKCFVVQIADANPKGWIPRSVITLVSTRELPASVKKLNKLLSKMPRQSVSKMLTITPFIPKVPTRSASSISISSTSSSSQRSYHRKISSFSGGSLIKNSNGTDIHSSSSSSDEFLSNEKGNNNKRSVDKKIPTGASFWKSFIQTILFFGGNSSQGGSKGNLNSGRFIIAAFAYSLVDLMQ
ncbi:serine/threonine protein kinase [Rhizophagus clarus]|uniref:Serine/threonine protein kinase n=1 Tax=Rhizophagus clarus TaxID=94130 RepID=A0A8H3MBL8_9GLOM|nr:serine/threonine protein kinase [Rhizophagus clarus]